jgi:thiosulfate/3-mercaptopyruvate sulfurtransferase
MESPLILADDLLSRRIDAFRILDARPGSDAYAQGHLVGAIHADLNRDLSSALLPGHDPARGGRHPLPTPAWFGARLDSWGITPETNVVVYDDQGGANAAARAWWMLRAIGHERVRVLDGGWKSARAAGIAVTQDTPHFAPTKSAWRDVWGRPTVMIDEVAKLAHESDHRVLDVRSGERFRGESESLDPVAGHIPGARNLFYGENLTPDGAFKPEGELRAMYTQWLAGCSPERLVVQCGSGVTACHTLLALEIAGMQGAALYVGSWSEWCRSGREQARGE